MRTILAAAIAMTAIPAHACDQASAETTLLDAESAGILSGWGLVDGFPAIEVDGPTWQAMDPATRRSVFDTLECYIAGDGSIARAIAVDGTGSTVAIWDGYAQEVQAPR